MDPRYVPIVTFGLFLLVVGLFVGCALFVLRLMH
jgi:hypothetical protein